jgi:hypothetical protein
MPPTLVYRRLVLRDFMRTSLSLKALLAPSTSDDGKTLTPSIRTMLASPALVVLGAFSGTQLVACMYGWASSTHCGLFLCYVGPFSAETLSKDVVTRMLEELEQYARSTVCAHESRPFVPYQMGFA